MSVQTLDIAEPFFTLRIISREASYPIAGKTIVLNLAEEPMKVREQSLEHLQSAVLVETVIENVSHAILVERFCGS